MANFLRWLTLLLGVLAVSPNIIELPNGKLLGQDHGSYISYESIPYAEPPIGSLRFEAPQPLQQNWTGILNATQTSTTCLQWNPFLKNPINQSRLIGVEDCLKLSVHVPKSSTYRTYPVVVNIHGGAFMFGGITDYSSQRISQAGNSIVVAISYRLGPLGFLSAEHSDLPGNYGLKDQRLALEWTRKNIAYFGGEPDNIVLVGHSAGGASVNFQLLQLDFASLAKAAVSFSGVALNPWAMTTQARERAFVVGDLLACDHNYIPLKLKLCLQSRSAEDIVSTVEQFFTTDYVPFTVFGPVIEDPTVPKAFLTKHPRVAMEAGEYSQVPWLVSYTKEDGGYNAASLLQRSNDTQRELIELLNTRWLDLAPHYLFYQQEGPSTYARSMQLRKQYMDTDSFSLLSYSKVEKMFTDILFKNGIEEVIRLHRFKGHSPMYAYLYDYPAISGLGQILSNRNDIQFGTVHGDDYCLLFPASWTSGMRADEEVIVDKFYKMLANFARNPDEILKFGSCSFVNNINEPLIQLNHITRDGCVNLKVGSLP